MVTEALPLAFGFWKVRNSENGGSVVPSAKYQVVDGADTPTCSWPPVHPLASKYIWRSATQSTGAVTLTDTSRPPGGTAKSSPAHCTGVAPDSRTQKVRPAPTRYVRTIGDALLKLYTTSASPSDAEKLARFTISVNHDRS